MSYIKRYAKAIVALLLLAVAAIGSMLGVETGIDPEAQWQAVGLVLLTAIGVYQVPNREETDGE